MTMRAMPTTSTSKIPTLRLTAEDTLWVRQFLPQAPG